MTQSEQIKIGPGNPEMFGEIADLYNRTDGFDNPDHIDLDAGYFQDSYSRLGLLLEQDVIAARTASGKLIGLAVLNLRGHDRPSAYISIHVDPSYRERGVGSRLLAECERMARDRKATRLECNIPSFREYTIAFVKRRGFTQFLTWIKYANYDIGKIKRPRLPKGFEIREIQDEEAETWAKLQNELFAERPLYKPVSKEDFLRLTKTRDFARELCIFGYYKNELVGYCINQVFRPTEKEDKRLFPQGLGVIPEFRGRGYGRALFEEIHWRAARLGIKISEFVVEDTNKIGISLYTSVGFKPRYLRIWYIKNLSD